MEGAPPGANQFNLFMHFLGDKSCWPRLKWTSFLLVWVDGFSIAIGFAIIKKTIELNLQFIIIFKEKIMGMFDDTHENYIQYKG